MNIRSPVSSIVKHRSHLASIEWYETWRRVYRLTCTTWEMLFGAIVLLDNLNSISCSVVTSIYSKLALQSFVQYMGGYYTAKV